MNWKFYAVIVLLVTDVQHKKEETEEIKITRWEKFQSAIKDYLGEEESEKFTEIMKFLISRTTRRWNQINSLSR